MSMEEVLRMEMELVHPWPEWIELMERLAQQKYFDLSRADEDWVAAEVPIDLSEVKEEEVVALDFSRDWITVRNACLNFGRDRFDILKSLSKKDIQILVGHGCPSTDPKAVFSAKLLRKFVHLDEGDVCSSCNLRNSCSRGYLLTLKEDEARTLDVMRILLTYGFNHVKGTVENKPLMKIKSVKTVARKLIHEVVKLSAVPIDPRLPQPVIKKPSPKVKQPPPPRKKRVGRDDVEMKKGDWLCSKCDFMNFAKNTICLQCDAKRPKRQLLPGEWVCPQCNFLNYRRNMACFHCEHKRPPDEYTENQMEEKHSRPQTRLEKTPRMSNVPNAWNLDFDDDESDGADVAAFEFADTAKMGDSSSFDSMSYRDVARSSEVDTFDEDKITKKHKRDMNFSQEGKANCDLHSCRTGFDDFDDEEDDNIDSFELDTSKHGQASGVMRKSFSELEMTSDSEDLGGLDHHRSSNQGAEDFLASSEDDDDLVNRPSLKSSHIVNSWRKAGGRSGLDRRSRASFGLDSDEGLISNLDGDMDENSGSRRRKSQQKPDRAFRSKGRVSFSNDEPLRDMCSDEDDYGSNDRSRKSFHSFSNDAPSRGSRSNGRGSLGEQDVRSRRNESFDSFDILDGVGQSSSGRTRNRGQTDQQGDRRDLGRNGKGPGRGQGDRWVDDGLHDVGQSLGRTRDRANQPGDRSRNFGRNGKGPGREERGRWGDDGDSNGREGFNNRRSLRNTNISDRFGDFSKSDDCRPVYRG